MSKTVQFTIGASPPRRLDKALARDVPPDAALSRSRLMRLIAQGAVTVDGFAITNAKAAVAAGAVVTVTLQQAADSHILPEAIALDIRYEDDDLIVVNKPVGVVVHPAPGTPSGTLVNALMHHCGAALSGVGGVRRPGIVHRIDKDTSGLLVVAKTDRAHHHLAAQFAAHSVRRRYLALCYGVPDAADPRLRGIKGVSFEPGNIGKLQSFLGRHRTDRQRQAVSFTTGRHAVTRFRVLQNLQAAALVECWLETGRTHQIRVHMAYCGHALIGDPTYGGRRKLSERLIGPEAVQAADRFDRQALHAATLGFVHPVNDQTLEFSADMPPDMVSLLRAFAGDI